MTSSEEHKRITEALESLASNWSPPPTIERFDFEVGEDAAGDRAIFVIAVLAESTEDANWTRENLEPVSHAVKSSIRDKDVDRLIYTRFARPSELGPTEDEA